jgi:hypothetical protein
MTDIFSSFRADNLNGVHWPPVSPEVIHIGLFQSQLKMRNMSPILYLKSGISRKCVVIQRHIHFLIYKRLNIEK